MRKQNRRKQKITVVTLAAAMTLSLMTSVPVLAAETDLAAETEEPVDNIVTEVTDETSDDETLVSVVDEADEEDESTEEISISESEEEKEENSDSSDEDDNAKVESESTDAEEPADDGASETSKIKTDADNNEAKSEKNKESSDYVKVPESNSNGTQLDNLGYKATISVSPQVILADSDTGYILNMNVSGNAPVRVLFPGELCPIDKAFQENNSGNKEIIANGLNGDITLQFSLSKEDAERFLEKGIDFFVQLPGNAGNDTLTTKVSLVEKELVTSTEEETPSVEEAPSEAETPSVEEVPSQAETPSVEEVPSQEETPSVEEAPSEEQTPSVEEAPSQEETPSIEEVPSEEQTPSVEEAPSEAEIPSVEEVPSQAETPSIEEVPSEAETPSVEEVPSQKETPSVEEVPSQEEIVSNRSGILEGIETTCFAAMPLEKDEIVEATLPMPKEGFATPHTGDASFSAVKSIGWLLSALGYIVAFALIRHVRSK